MPQAEMPSGNQGCLALFIATALAALLLMFPLFTLEHSAVGVYAAIFFVTALVVTVLGMPLYLLALKTGRATAWTALLAGTITGVALPLLSALADGGPEGWRYVAIYALVGATGGLAFYLVATAPRLTSRPVALLLVLAGVAIGVAVLAGRMGQ